MTRGGRVTAVWDFTTLPGPSATFYADRTVPFAGGKWSQAFSLSAASTKPVLALDDSGDASATWLTTAPTRIVSAFRTGTGSFSSPKPLTGASDLSGQAHAVAASANGDALATYVGESNGTDAIFSARRRPGTDFDDIAPVATTPAGNTVSLGAPDVALDDEGNAFAVWQRAVSATQVTTAQVAGFDPVAPAITAADVPTSATAGQAVGMSAAASDRMSGPALHFDFGDGSGADGGAVQHVYGAAGAYTVTVTATDGAGNSSSASRAIEVAPAPPVTLPGPTTTAPTGPTGPQSLTATTAASWDRLRNGRTRMKALVVEGLAGPETVKLTCSPKRLGCRKAMTRTVTKHGKKVLFTKYVKGVTLRPKAVLTITVSRPGYISRVFSYTMVKGRDPKKATRCLAPGAKKTQAC
jgi:PKD repeat protein